MKDHNGPRRTILDAVNRWRLAHDGDAGARPPLRMRHIQRAAHIARKYRLVSGETLELAGFRDRGSH